MSSLTPSPLSSPASTGPEILPRFIPPCPTEHFFSWDVKCDFDLCASYFAAPNLCLECYRLYDDIVHKTYDRTIKELEMRMEENKVVEDLNKGVEKLETRRMEELKRLREAGGLSEA